MKKKERNNLPKNQAIELESIFRLLDSDKFSDYL